MQLTINPGDDSLDTLLAAGAYQRFWDTHGQTVLDSFTNMTGLSFQQDEITAQVLPGVVSSAGNADQPMTLNADYSTTEEKAVTLLHEVAHRLLGGNALSPIALGLVQDTAVADPHFQEFEHRHLYLFLYDVVLDALGEHYAAILVTYETVIEAADYQRAWHWAMDMNNEQRKRALQKLINEALPRDRWHERDDTGHPERDPNEWFAYLASD